MNPAMLSRIGQGLMGAVEGMGDPGRGLGRLLATFKRRRSQGAVLPNNPISAQHFPVPEMRPGGFGSMPGGPNIGPGMPPEMVPDPGFRPARPRFPGDPGIDPGMTPPPDQSPFGPVPLGGRRRPWRFGQGGGY